MLNCGMLCVAKHVGKHGIPQRINLPKLYMSITLYLQLKMQSAPIVSTCILVDFGTWPDCTCVYNFLPISCCTQSCIVGNVLVVLPAYLHAVGKIFVVVTLRILAWF